MSDEDKFKGVRDPWRRRARDTDESSDESGAPVGAEGSDHPMDWDLQTVRTFTLRVPNTIGSIHVKGVATQTNAAARLLDVVAEIGELREALLRQGLEFSATKDRPNPIGFHIVSKDHTLCCPSAASTADGFNRLVRTLLGRCAADASFHQKLVAAGITPILRGN